MNSMMNSFGILQSIRIVYKMFEGFVCTAVVINLLVSIEILDIVNKILEKM